MRRISLFIIIMSSTVMQAPPVNALPDSEKLNLREACRQAVSGEYMAAFDNVRASKSYLVQVETMIKRVSVAHTDASAEFSALQSKVDRVTYDVSLSDRLIQQKEKVKSLAGTLELYQQQLGTAREKLLIVANRESYLKKHIETVFKIVWNHSKEYPTGIEYKSECPKFRHMCQLPDTYHEPLENIRLKDDGEAVCSRYISFSRAGKR